MQVLSAHDAVMFLLTGRLASSQLEGIRRYLGASLTLHSSYTANAGGVI